MQYFALLLCYDTISLIARKLCKTRQGRTVDSRFSPAYPTTDKHPLGYTNHIINLIVGHLDNSRSFIMRKHPEILDAPLYIAVHFELIMKFLNPLRFGLFIGLVNFCPWGSFNMWHPSDHWDISMQYTVTNRPSKKSLGTFKLSKQVLFFLH